jgi:hypothetical protein
MIVLETHELEIATTDDAGDISVGAEEHAVEGHDIAVNPRNEVAQQLRRRDEVAGDRKCDFAQPRAGKGSPGERRQRREAAEDLGEHIITTRIPQNLTD